MKINKDEYIKLINDDAKWLVENTENSLEREHILKVLWASINLQYQPNASQQPVRRLNMSCNGCKHSKYNFKNEEFRCYEDTEKLRAMIGSSLDNYPIVPDQCPLLTASQQPDEADAEYVCDCGNKHTAKSPCPYCMKS